MPLELRNILVAGPFHRGARRAQFLALGSAVADMEKPRVAVVNASSADVSAAQLSTGPKGSMPPLAGPLYGRARLSAGAGAYMKDGPIEAEERRGVTS